MRTLNAFLVAVACLGTSQVSAENPIWKSVPDTGAAARKGEVVDSDDSSTVETTSFYSTTCYEDFCGEPSLCDEIGCLETGCDGEDCAAEGGDCCVCSDKPLLSCLRDRDTCFGDLKCSVGGSFRYRYMDEHNRLRPQGTLGRDTYDLWRFTPFMQIGNDWITGYAQGIDAPIFDEDLPKLPIDENRWDLLQYYVDVKVLDLDSGSGRVRYGRQLLLYGDQHLISPLAWSNTFRTFEGGKAYWEGDSWNVDAFSVRPSNGAASAQVFQPYSFDDPDQSVLFSGVYATYKKAPNGTMDLYWLWNNESEPVANRQDGNRHTVGVRYAGALPVKSCKKVSHTWEWDAQGGWQFGNDTFISGGADQDVNAGFVSAVGGLTLNKVAWTPNIKGVFWWGSGDRNPADGDINTVYTLYPLGHAYWGQIDNFNGANLLDYSIQGSIKPMNKVTLAAHMHWFDKASTDDFIYNIAGAPLGNGTTPDRHIGNELDLLATYQASANLQIQLGYFFFWYGDAVNNDPTLQRDDAEQVYLMTTLDF